MDILAYFFFFSEKMETSRHMQFYGWENENDSIDQVLVNQACEPKFNSSTFVKFWSCQYSPATPTIAPGIHRCIIDVHYPVRLAKSMSFVSSHEPCLKEDGERSINVSLTFTWILTHLHMHHNAPVNISAQTYYTWITHTCTSENTILSKGKKQDVYNTMWETE